MLLIRPWVNRQETFFMVVTWKLYCFKISSIKLALSSVSISVHPWCYAMPSPFSRAWLFVTALAAARRASLSMGSSRQEYWSGLPLTYPWIHGNSYQNMIYQRLGRLIVLNAGIFWWTNKNRNVSNFPYCKIWILLCI